MNTKHDITQGPHPFERCIQAALIVVQNHPEMRYGQALSNAVWDIHPELSKRVIGNPELDPFNVSADSDIITAFCEYCFEHWEDFPT